MTTTKIELTTEQLAKVQECLDILQEAQNLCDHAAQALCSVPGFADQWSKLSKADDAVKNAWYMVAARRDKLTYHPSGGTSGGSSPTIASS